MLIERNKSMGLFNLYITQFNSNDDITNSVVARYKNKISQDF